MPRGSCRGALQTANLRRVPLAIQVSRIPRLMGELSPVTSSHVPDPVPEEGNPPQHGTRGNQVLGPTRGKPKLAVGRTKNGPRSEPIAGPRGREQRCRFIQQSAASPKRRINGGQFAIASLLSREMDAVSRVRARSIARPASGEPEMGGQESQLPQAVTSALDGAVRRPIVATERRMGQRTKL